jgi:hypothetical protein
MNRNTFFNRMASKETTAYETTSSQTHTNITSTRESVTPNGGVVLAFFCLFVILRLGFQYLLANIWKSIEKKEAYQNYHKVPCSDC